MFDVDQLNRVFDIKGNGDDVISVEIAIEDPGRNGVAIQMQIPYFLTANIRKTRARLLLKRQRFQN